jgi:hypothetical protein
LLGLLAAGVLACQRSGTEGETASCCGPPAYAAHATAPEITPDKPSTPDPHQWQELFDGKTLGKWKPLKEGEFISAGPVEVQDGMLVLGAGTMMTGVVYTGEIPRDNYELSLEGMRLDGADFFCTTTFPVGKDCCSLVVGGWGGTTVGLSCVDDMDASENDTSTTREFKDKQWYQLRIRVSESRVEAWIDKDRVVDQPRKDHKFNVRMECELCQPLGIATYATKGAVRAIRIRQLNPGEIRAAMTQKDEPQDGSTADETP